MPRERTVAPIAGFYKFVRTGQLVAGLVKRYGTGENGAFIVMEPVIIRDGKEGPTQTFQSAAIGLSTDLTLKVNQNDVGKAMSLEFVDKEATKKGSDKKIFRVMELDRGELIGLAEGADRSNRNNPYSRQLAQGDDSDTIAPDTDDDLPF